MESIGEMSAADAPPTRSGIRFVEPADAARIAAIYGPMVESTAVSFEAVPPDAHEVGRRIEQTVQSYPWLVCDVDGEVAGYAYATQHRVRAAYRWSVDTSVYVDERFRRQGVGRGLYASVTAILGAQGYYNAYAGITLPNAASVALHESAGFMLLCVYPRVGYKCGAWHDVGWWQLSLAPHQQSPSEPLDLATLRQRENWPTLLTSGTRFLRAARP